MKYGVTSFIYTNKLLIYLTDFSGCELQNCLVREVATCEHAPFLLLGNFLQSSERSGLWSGTFENSLFN